MATPGDVRYRETQERFWVLELVTEVRDDGVHVKLGPVPGSATRIPFDDVADVRVTTYDASTYGGWHFGQRTTLGGDTAYRLRGNRGVELRRGDGSRVFVGSRRPDDLATAIRDAAGL